jgi:hypothetical protein
VNAALALSVGMTRSWVALYTLGVPLAIRDARRSEIDSDLWEQQWLASRCGDPAFGTAIEVLARMLLGIMSDITWRAQTGLSTRAERSVNVTESWYMRGLLAVGVVVAVLTVLAGIGAAADALIDPDTADGDAAFAAVFAIAGVAVLFGLLTSRRNPVLGIGLVAAGVITASFMFYWIWMIGVPIAIGLVAIAFFRARSSGWPRGAGTA